MLRKLVGSALLLVFVGVAMAAEMRGVITKVDGGKVTFTEIKGKDMKGDPKDYAVADGVKVVKGKFNKDTKKVEAGDAIEGGLKSETFSKISDKGVGATVVVEGDKITEIRVVQRKQ